MIVDYEEWFVFPSDLQCKFSFLTKNETPIEMLMLHKESHICLVKMNTSVDYT
jgi:hypothetical protein